MNQNDILDIFLESGLYDRWISAFCADCPNVTHIPATLETPAEDYCPCDFSPFDGRGCVKSGTVDMIIRAAAMLDSHLHDA